MYTPISIEHKRDFIQWFLEHYTLKRQEANWLLNFLLKDDDLLNRISFVNDAKYCPRAIIISSHCSDEVPFLFYKQHIITTDIDKFFHDIRLNDDEFTYVQLNFEHAKQNPYYVGILEENPYTPICTSHQIEDERMSTRLLDGLIQNHQLKRLQNEIDEALDRKDEVQFNKLVKILKNINES